jgi:hypothetical protein
MVIKSMYCEKCKEPMTLGMNHNAIVFNEVIYDFCDKCYEDIKKYILGFVYEIDT